MMTNSELRGGNNGRGVKGLRRGVGMASFHVRTITAPEGPLHGLDEARVHFDQPLAGPKTNDVVGLAIGITQPAAALSWRKRRS
jgi:hypothetical protein